MPCQIKAIDELQIENILLYYFLYRLFRPYGVGALRKLKLSHTSELRSALKNAITRSLQSRFLHRLHCVLLVAEGCNCYEVAAWFGENPRTIERWVHQANEFGLEGLKDEQKTGRPAKVHDDQLKQLQVTSSCNPREFGYNQDDWDGPLLRIHLTRFYRIELSVRQCQRLLHKLQHSARKDELIEN